jgi:hypothetical protein
VSDLSIIEQEAREASRRRVLKTGSIVFNRAGHIDCLIRNLSLTGACLEVVSPIGIPDRFILLVRSGKAEHRHSCHVAWRKENRIGVAFD